MVQTITITGVTSARTTPFALTPYVDMPRQLVNTRLFFRRSYAIAAHSHAGVAHSHAGVAHSHGGVAHSHDAINAAAIGASNNANAHKMMWSNSQFITSIAHGEVPDTSAATQPVAAATQNVAAATQGIAAGGAIAAVFGVSLINFTIDSLGRVVNTATHPATGHAALKQVAATGVMQMELGDAIRATDLLVISALLAKESGGIM